MSAKKVKTKELNVQTVIYWRKLHVQTGTDSWVLPSDQTEEAMI